MKKIILIPATLTVRTCLRIFFATERVDTTVTLDVSDCYRDFPVGQSPVDTHDDIVRFIRARLLKRPPGGESPGLWVGRGVNMRALAYQLVETSTLSQLRRILGHPNPEPSVVTTKVLGKKVFLVGQKITRARARKLRAWVESQVRLPREDRDDDGFKRRNISCCFPVVAGHFLAGSRQRFGIKIGCATIVALDPKKVALRPTEP